MIGDKKRNKEKYIHPKVLSHQPIRFETSQSWKKGQGPVSGDPGKSDGDKYPHDPYDPNKFPKPRRRS